MTTVAHVIRIDVRGYQALGVQARAAFDEWMDSNDVPKKRCKEVRISSDIVEADCFLHSKEGRPFLDPAKLERGIREPAVETLRLPLRTKLPKAVEKAVA